MKDTLVDNFLSHRWVLSLEYTVPLVKIITKFVHKYPENKEIIMEEV